MTSGDGRPTINPQSKIQNRKPKINPRLLSTYIKQPVTIVNAIRRLSLRDIRNDSGEYRSNPPHCVVIARSDNNEAIPPFITRDCHVAPLLAMTECEKSHYDSLSSGIAKAQAGRSTVPG